MIVKTTAPDSHTKEKLKALINACCRHDKQQLSYPVNDADSHYLYYTQDGHLASAAAMTSLGGGVTECSAFTLPACRRQGYFSDLLKQALSDFDETDILFACEPDCNDTISVLEHLQAEFDTCEYQMEYVFCRTSRIPTPTHPDLSLTFNRQEDGTLYWQLFLGSSQIGSCHTTRIGKNRVCLHQFIIQENRRRQGFGQDLLWLLMTHLSDLAINTVILQLSGRNPAALALYTKTGFSITRTLSYYYY